MRYPYSVERKLLDQISSNDHFVFTTDLEANITFCNDAFQRLYQIVGESVQGVNIDSLINSTDAGLIKDTIHQTLLTKSTDPINLKLKHPGINSSENIIHYEFSVVNDRRSYPVAFLLIGKTAAASVLQSNTTTSTNAGGAGISGQNREWFREIADYMKEMMWMSNHQHQINFVNKAWLKFRGVSLENESGNGWMDGIYLEDKYQVTAEQNAAYLAKSDYAIQFRYRKFDATYRWVEMQGSPMYTHLGDFVGYAGTLQDVTNMKELQLQMNRQKEMLEVSKVEFAKFTKIAQRINVVIILCDPGYRITWVNDSFVKLTGFPLREVNGKEPIAILSGPDTAADSLDKLRQAISQGKSLRTEIVFYAKNGNKIWLDLKMETLFDKQGNIIGYLTIQNDITKKKMTEKDVEEQMAHLKQISDIASFELRHEFSKILQILQTAKFQQNTLQGYQQILLDIESSANTMNQAILKISDEVSFASSSNIALNKFLLNQAIEEIILVDDDHMINKLNTVIIRNVIPNMTVTVFDNIDDAITYLKGNPTLKRKIFLDLNFMGRNGWDFLEEYEKMNQPWPVIILTSSIDHNDYEKSKKYSNVTHFITKPLTVPQFEELSALDEASPVGN
ncbi:PAS domain S-box protein [Sediminibacterium sp.]|uniref:PAS domain S-box protein n=1 Tax=Sediminibacterium sp. TaxID=1917865 RepID=UPI0027239E9E|nr:PAS domain S-box protein [Sediminibacterium sp.]MDO8996630.1 PAS domain S-box protein [Sediminibacterium sp.]MDP1971602.1 PAS domain S-box protein [Sediminibacterium sp.]MDP2421154.1 PAS domain S-box protein [Sediminibacterium sp.]